MSDVATARGQRFLDRDFRWRGTDVSRMEAFADAVFALVLALLFLRATPPENIGELKATMKGLLPFVVTFVLLAMVWVDHHRFFRRYGLVDKTTFFGNLALLFLVLFYAYPLKFLFTLLSVMWFGPIGTLDATSMTAGQEAGDPHRMMLFYGSGFGAIYLTFVLLYWHAFRRADDLGLDEVERHATITSMLECLVLVGFALLSLGFVALDQPATSGLVYFGIGPCMALLGWRRGAAQRVLVRARGAGRDDTARPAAPAI
ncbi:MAG TPA: TMEM175 family protein [Planctomycetota bacterium]|nr:TMEM175 family protein [Planctomycetota bacterium]